MASGKTTFGKALARATGLQHIDLDFFIEQRFHCKIKDIFAQKGEAEFRRIESNLLREIGEFSDVIISCGGGTPCFGDNMDYMNSRGTTVCLKASDDVIATRILAAGDKRPSWPASRDRKCSPPYASTWPCALPSTTKHKSSSPATASNQNHR